MSDTDSDLKTHSTSTDVPTDDEQHHVASEPPPRSSVVQVISPAHSQEGSRRRRGGGNNSHTFVSIHRRELDRIRDDALHNRVYSVPHYRDSVAEEEEHRRSKRNCLQKMASQVNQNVQKTSCNDVVEYFLPSWRWMRIYKWRSTLLTDVIAGLTVGVMVVPQSMSCK